jgi:steroid Delta-isomerase
MSNLEIYDKATGKTSLGPLLPAVRSANIYSHSLMATRSDSRTPKRSHESIAHHLLRAAPAAFNFNQPLTTSKENTMKKQPMSKIMALLFVLMALPFAAPIRAGSAAAKAPPAMMSLTPEQIEAAVEEYFDSVGAFDVQRYVNNFAPDGVLEDPVGTPPIQDTQAITAFITAIIAPFSEIKHKIQDINVCGQEAAVNWKLNLKTTTGKKIVIDGMGVFKFNQNGKLQSLRQFWDLEAFLAALQSQ